MFREGLSNTHPLPNPKFHTLLCFLFGLVVIQSYESEADNEYVIRGNSVVMKCEIPSYVADFVFVDLWLDSEGRNYYPNNAEETGTWPWLLLACSTFLLGPPISIFQLISRTP